MQLLLRNLFNKKIIVNSKAALIKRVTHSSKVALKSSKITRNSCVFYNLNMSIFQESIEFPKKL